MGVLILSLRGGQNGRRGNPSCLGIYFLRVRYGYCGTVDRHAPKGLAMTRVVRTSVEIAVCSPCRLFNLHSSIFTLPFTEPIFRILFHIHHFMLVRGLKSALMMDDDRTD
jgi:hypothetical protein